MPLNNKSLKKTILKSFTIPSCLIMMFLLVTTSCNDSSLIGAEVVDPDRADVEFTDTLTLKATTIEGDPVETYNSLSLLGNYLCGTFDDPILGKSKAIINTQIRLSGIPDSATFAGISEEITVLDSVVFVLEYDTANFFGFSNTIQDVSISLLDEDMDNNETYTSDRSFAAASTPLFSKVVNPSQFDTTFAQINLSGDTVYAPQLRISLEQGDPLLNDPLFTDYLFPSSSSVDPLQYYQNDTFLLQVLKGFQIEVNEGTSTPNLMMSFNLSSPISGMYLYYSTPNDTLFYRFSVNSSAARMVNFTHDYNNPNVNSFIDDTNLGDSLVFLQGMSGLNAKFSIPYARDLNNVIVNQAQLELTVATILPDDNSTYYLDPITQLLLSKKDEDGDFVIISDLEAALSLGNITGVFGGDLTEENGNNVVLQKYTMNISDHLQDIIDGVESSDEIFVTALAKAQNAQRVILFGPGHSTYPAKLNLTYTINQ